MHVQNSCFFTEPHLSQGSSITQLIIIGYNVPVPIVWYQLQMNPTSMVIPIHNMFKSLQVKTSPF